MTLIDIALLIAASSVLFSSALACGFYLGHSATHASAYALSPTKGKTAHAVAPAIARKLSRNEASTAQAVRVISPRKKAASAIIVGE